jgi:hypothetical protein
VPDSDINGTSVNQQQQWDEEVATIGAPAGRFCRKLQCAIDEPAAKKKRAQSLTRLVRERDGGLSGKWEIDVAGYSNGRWKSFCNLFAP